MTKGLLALLAGGAFFLAALPSTTNYELNSYGFGSGGTAGSSTSNYSLEGITGEISGQTAATSNYSAEPGFIETQQANVPKITLTNPSNYYDKLHFVIDQQSNPTDALYALQVCVGSDWVAGSCGGTTMYVKNDNTLESSLSVADYQKYTTWGGSGGANIIGLTPSTTYYIRAKATQGQFTESAYGPSSGASTSAQQISFCLYTNANCGAGGASESFSGLVAGTPATSPSNIGVDFATNADSGGSVYIYSANGALVSVSAPGSPITSATADLGSGATAQGFGAQVISTSQTSGSLTKLSPYNLGSNNVGQISTVANTILSASSPLVGGQAAIQLQAKASNTTPSASDYTDTVTLIAAASF